MRWSMEYKEEYNNQEEKQEEQEVLETRRRNAQTTLNLPPAHVPTDPPIHHTYRLKVRREINGAPRWHQTHLT